MPPRVSRDEIAVANRTLARLTGGLTMEASDILRRAEEAGQVLTSDTYFPEGSEFARTQLTDDPLRDQMDRKLRTVTNFLICKGQKPKK